MFGFNYWGKGKWSGGARKGQGNGGRESRDSKPGEEGRLRTQQASLCSSATDLLCDIERAA